MTEHLPECWAKHPSDPPAWCICDELRACEERVMRAVMHTVDVDSYEEGKRDCKATHPVLALKEITRIASKGYDTGLDAAREAIDGLMPSEFWEGIPTRTAQWWVVKAEALAAIDALREKQ